jgi:hypothetical protein
MMEVKRLRREKEEPLLICFFYFRFPLRLRRLCGESFRLNYCALEFVV